MTTKVIQVSKQDTIAKLYKAIKDSTDEEQKTRIRAIINIKKGATKTATAELFVVSRTSIVSWVNVYNEEGVGALAMSKGGRPEGNPRWDTSIFEKLVEEIDKGGYWSIPLMQEWIKTHYEKEIPEQTVWYHMNKLNYSYKSARPHPIKGDKEKQDIFKKKVWCHS